jgi:hypothetical protein
MSTATLERANVRAANNGHLVLPDGTIWQIPPHPLSGRIQPPDELIPRVCVVPDYAFSSGPEAIELARSAGLILDPWEELALILGLGETAAGKWAAFQVALIVARQNGKGAVLEALGLYWLFGTGEALIGHTAHEYKTAMEAFRRILSLIENTDWMRKKVKKVINTNGEEGIELLTGQRLRFLARSKGAGRGFTFRKLIWDEAYALNPEQQEAQLPTLSAVPNAQIWVTSSPPLTSDTGIPLFTLRRNAKPGGSTAFLDYGADGNLDALETIDLDAVAAWLKTNPNAPERISVEAIARERAALSDRGFARERLGIWPPDLEQGFTVISKELWEAMTDPTSGAEDGPTALVGRPVIAPDVSPRIGGVVQAAIGLASRRQDDVHHIELIKQGSGSAWLVRDLVSMHMDTRAIIVIDPGSPAGSILADLYAALRIAYDDSNLNTDGIVYTMTSRDVAQAFGMIYDAATRPLSEPRTVVHLGQEELTLAVGGADKRPVGDGHAWDRREASTDITPIISVTHALWKLVGSPRSEVEPMVIWG